MNKLQRDTYLKKTHLKILIFDNNANGALNTEKEIKKEFKNSSIKYIEVQNKFNFELDNFRPDIIISEICLAVSELEAIVKVLSSTKKEIPLIIHSSMKNEKQVINYLDNIACDFVAKENPARLVYALLNAIEQRNLKMELLFAQNDLREYEKYVNRYRRWESNVPALTYLYVQRSDGSQAFTYVSPASEKLFGLSPEAIVGNPMLLMSRAHPEDLSGLMIAISESAETLKPFRYQIRYAFNGVLQWFDIHSIPEKEANGDIVWDGIMTDITEQKNAEIALAKEHNLMYALLDNIPDIIYFKDVESRFIKVNKGYLKKFGLNHESEILGKTDFDLFNFAHANEARLDEKEIIHTGNPIISKIEKEVWSSGKVTWVSSTKMPLKDPGGNITGTFGISKDVTEQKNAEEQLKLSESRFRYLISSTTTVLFSIGIFEDQFNITWVGDNVKDLLGYTPEEVMKPGWGIKSIHPDDKDYAASMVVSLYETNKLDLEFRLKHVEGHYVWLRTELVLIRNSEGTPLEILGSWLDITERMMAQEALLNSEAQLSYALKIASLAYWEYDVFQDQFLFNDQFYKIHKTTAETEGGYALSSGEYVERFVHPEDAYIIGSEIKKGIETTDSNFNDQIEYRIIFTGGENGYMSVRFFITKDVQGRTNKVFGVIQNITERKQAENTLRKSEAQLSEALQMANLAYWEYDIVNGIFTFNDQFYSLYRTTAEKEGGYQMPAEIYAERFVHPEDRGLVGIEIQKIIETNDAGFSGNLEHRIVYADGETGYIVVRFSIIKDADGNTVKSYGANQDITKRKLAEEALRTSEYILRKSQSAARVGSYKINLQTGRWDGSQTLNEIMGISENYPRDSEGHLRLIHPDYRDFIINTLREISLLKTSRIDVEYKVIRQNDGMERWVWSTGDVELDKDGKPTALIGTVQDITDRILREQEKLELENQLRERNKELEKMVTNLKMMQGTLVQTEKMASLGQLSAGIAHEINNPLAFVCSNVNRLKEYFQDTVDLLLKWQDLKTVFPFDPDVNLRLEEIEKYSEQIDLKFILKDFDLMMISIQDGTQRIKKIVEGMRGFSHISENSISESNINKAIEDTLTIVMNEIKYKAEIEILYGTIPAVECNVGEIKQVIVNLLVNAAQAIEEKGIIQISTYAQDEFVFIKVRDSGCGIPQDKIKRIFDPFFTTKPVGKGTGLGLWICSSIIEKHFGTITVESVPGTGTTFIIKLPVIHKTLLHRKND